MQALSLPYLWAKTFLQVIFMINFGRLLQQVLQQEVQQVVQKAVQ